jgi:hypothetical protein
MIAPTNATQPAAAPYRRRTVTTVRKNAGAYDAYDRIKLRARMDLHSAIAVLAPRSSTAGQRITIKGLLVKAGFQDGILDFSRLTKAEVAT